MMDSYLVTRSLNFHGDQLLSLLVAKCSQKLQLLRLQDIDYKLHRSRIAVVRRLGCYAEEIIDFIASKAEFLMIKESLETKLPPISREFFLDRGNYQYPLEYLLKIPRKIRFEQLINILKPGDILLVMINQSLVGGYILKMLSFGDQYHRFIHDLLPTDLRIMLPASNTSVNEGKYIVGTRLRVKVVEFDKSRSTIEVTLQDQSADLGKIKIADVPAVLSSVFNPSIKSLSQCLEKMETFQNPKSIQYLSKMMNVSLISYPSLMASLRSPYPKEEMALFLRKKQLNKWAHRYVVDAVHLFKDGKEMESFQCLERALSIDPDNEDALVAKGGILANLGRYEKAIGEFQKALEINSNNSNARDYVCRTLIELGREYERDCKYEEAETAYVKCLDIDGSNVEARKALQLIISELNPTKNVELSPIEKEWNGLSDLQVVGSKLKLSSDEMDENEESNSSMKTDLSTQLQPATSYSAPFYPLKYTTQPNSESYDAKVDAFLKQCKGTLSARQRSISLDKQRKTRRRSSSSESWGSSERRRKNRHKRSRSRDRKHPKRRRKYRSRSRSSKRKEKSPTKTPDKTNEKSDDKLDDLQKKLEMYCKKYGPLPEVAPNGTSGNCSTSKSETSSEVYSNAHPAFRDEPDEYTCAPPKVPKSKLQSNLHKLMENELKQRDKEKEKITTVLQKLKHKQSSSLSPDYSENSNRAKYVSSRGREVSAGRSLNKSKYRMSYRRRYRSRSRSRRPRSRSRSRHRRRRSRSRSRTRTTKRSHSKSASSSHSSPPEKEVETKPVEEPSPFGKWDSPTVVSPKTALIKEMEERLKAAKEKKLKEMKERNKEFLKPNLD